MIGVRVLGPVEVHRDGERTAVRPGKTTEVLVHLALHAGVLVPTERLIEDLWADAAVGTARNTLQTKVSRLRRALGSAALVTGSSAGYTLEVDPAAVDALAVLALAEEAAAHQAAGAAAAALEVCTTALALFRGDVLPGAGDGDWVTPHRVRLEEVRLGLVETRVAALLDLGRGAEAVGELEALLRRHPLREGLWALLITALYRDGRQADALAAYRRVRAHLAEELGIDPGPTLQALERQILLQDPQLGARPPAAPAPSPPPGNLPGLSAPMVGRHADLAAVADLVGGSRLVTVVGPAGVGKSRLAVEVARGVERAGGRWLVRLEGAQDEASAVRAVAEALGIAGGTEDLVVDHLRASDALLVLDGCEHLTDAVAAVVTRLLDTAPWLGVLATSQAPLGLDGEATYALDPLDLDDSVELFTRRAREQRRSLVVDEEAEAVIAQLCRALDGLPLAIELAAARARTLSVEEIDRRLADRFTLLADPTSRRPERRRALGAAIAWSYDLLFPDDQTGLWALACFTGGAPLPAVEHVLEALGIPRASAVDVVGRLADRSLVAVEVEGEAVRYRLLDSIRLYAREKLDASGSAAVAQAAHAAWFAEAAAAAAAGLRGPDQARHLARARGDGANIDAALAWAEAHDPALGLRLANGFGWAWFVLGEGAAGTARLRRSLAAADGSPGDRVTALCTTAWIEASNDVERAHADATAALEIATRAGDEHLVASSRIALAFVHLQQGRPHEVGPLLDGCPEVLRRLDRPWEEGAAWILAAHAALALGDVAGARRAGTEGEPLVRACGDDWALSHLAAVLAHLAQAEGRLDAAADHLRSAAEACHRLGFRATEGLHLAALGRVLQRAGDPAGAVAALEEAIEVGRSAQELRVVALARVRLGRVLRAEGDSAAARNVVDAADHWFRSSGGGEGAVLATCLVVALAADHGDPVADGFAPVLVEARAHHDGEVEVLALDGLAHDRARVGDLAGAAEHLAAADALAPSVAHVLDDADRLDAHRARILVASGRSPIG